MESPRRLRSSCDACGAAKTKCDRAHPQCTRCTSMNLACVYGPSKQLGKRPRRRLEVASRFSDLREASSQLNDAYRNSAVEGYSTESSAVNTSSAFDPILEMRMLPAEDVSITPPQDIQLPVPSEKSIPFPASGFSFLADRHRCYHESNEVIQLLSIPERVFADEAPITLDVSQILHANRRAIESLNRLVDCNCTKTRSHQAVLYASLISRTLWWYREAAGDTVYWASEPVGIPSPNTSSDRSTPSPGPPRTVERCVRIHASAVTVGGFGIDDPHMQNMIRNQLIRHEMIKVGHLIEKYAAIVDDPTIQPTDKPIFQSLGTWLRADLAAALASVGGAGLRRDDD